MDRKTILDNAIQCVCTDREQQYGSPEDNFSVIAKFWGIYKGIPFTARDIAIMMTLLKVARDKTGQYEADNYADLAGYAAIAGELAESEKKNQSRRRGRGGWTMKYRKKPVTIEAFQYDGDLMGSNGEYYVPQWAVDALNIGTMYYDSEYLSEGPPCELYIQTLEGRHHVSVSDYIIKGIQGELYPCKPDIFEQTYEPAMEE